MSYIDVSKNQGQPALRRFMKRAMSAPMLEKDYEIELAKRWRDQDDEQALHELINAHIRLAISIASRYRNYGLAMSDLVQEGNVGLMQAAARFDYERDVRFSTYAGWWIRSSIQDFILRNWSIVRTGTTTAHKTLFFNLRRLRALINGGADGPLSDTERSSIADELRVRVKDVETMEGRLSSTDRSLNSVIGERTDTEWLEFLPDDRPGPEAIVIETLDTAQYSVWLNQALQVLNARELVIIQERRLQDKAVTLSVLGEKLGISKERVRQIEHQALGKLHAALLEQVDDPWAAGLTQATTHD